MATSDPKHDTLIFRCPGCNAKMSARRESAGKVFTCPRCKAAITVPRPDASSKARTTGADSHNAAEPKPSVHDGHAAGASPNPRKPRPTTTSDEQSPTGNGEHTFDDFDDFQPSPGPTSSGPTPRPSNTGTKPESSHASLLAGLRRISFRPNWSIPNVKLPNYLVRGRGSALEQVAERFAAAIDAQKGNAISLAFASESQNIPQHDRPFRILNSLKAGHKTSTDVSFKCQGTDLYVEFNAKCRTLTVYLKRLLYALMFCSLFLGLSAAYLTYTGAFGSWLEDSALKKAQVTNKAAEFLVRKQQEGYRIFTAATFAEKFQELKQASLVKELQARIDRDAKLLRETIPKIHSLVDELVARARSLESANTELVDKTRELHDAIYSRELVAIWAESRRNGGQKPGTYGGVGGIEKPPTGEWVLKILREKRARLTFKSDVPDPKGRSEERVAKIREQLSEQTRPQRDALDAQISRIERLTEEVKKLEARRESLGDSTNKLKEDHYDEFNIYGWMGSGEAYTRPESGFNSWLYHDPQLKFCEWPMKLIQDGVPKEKWSERVGTTRAKLAELYLIAGPAEGRIEVYKWLLNLNGHDLLLRLALSMQNLNANNSFEYRQDEYSVEFVPGIVAPYEQGYREEETPRDFNTRIDKIEFLDNVKFSSYLLENFSRSEPPSTSEASPLEGTLDEATRLKMVRIINEALQHSITEAPPATLAGLAQTDPKLFFLNNSAAFAVIGAIAGAVLWLLPATWIDPFCRILKWPTLDEFKKSTLAHSAWVERVLSDTLLHDFGVQEGDRFTVHAS